MYLENNSCAGLYGKSRVDILMVLTSQMANSLESVRILQEQVEKQTEKLKYVIVERINFQRFILLLRFDQLRREEESQRERADAAEKYKMQLENFIDMICHEIRNPYVSF
jgi:nitrogen-specific signal transduction histidine kinase